jgi:hypothetical protein
MVEPLSVTLPLDETLKPNEAGLAWEVGLVLAEGLNPAVFTSDELLLEALNVEDLKPDVEV